MANNKLINDATATGISPHPVLQTETGQKPSHDMANVQQSSDIINLHG